MRRTRQARRLQPFIARLGGDVVQEIIVTGVVDHGMLQGLADDDHTQYLNTTRHAAIDHTSLVHAAVTVSDTSTIDLTLTGQALSGAVIPAGIKLDDLGTPDDNTDLNAATTRHGLMPKLDNTVTHFYNGQGGQTVPDHGSTGGLADDDHTQYHTDARHAAIDHTGLVHAAVTVADTSTIDMSLTGQQVSGAVIPGGIKLDDLGTPDDNTDLNASITRHGLTPKLSNVAANYLSGAGTWTTPDHGALGGLADDDHAQYLLANGTRTLSGDLTYTGNLKPYRNSTAYTGYVLVPYQAPPATYAANGLSTTAKTLIDTSVSLGVPAGVKALQIRIAMRDSGSAANDCVFFLSPNNTADSGPAMDTRYVPNDAYVRGELFVPCNANGDIYYQVIASGAGTMDVSLQVWGYYI